MFSFAIAQQDQLMHLEDIDELFEESKDNTVGDFGDLSSMRIFEHQNKKPVMKNLTQHLAKIQLEMLDLQKCRT